MKGIYEYISACKNNVMNYMVKLFDHYFIIYKILFYFISIDFLRGLITHILTGES